MKVPRGSPINGTCFISVACVGSMVGNRRGTAEIRVQGWQTWLKLRSLTMNSNFDGKFHEVMLQVMERYPDGMNFKNFT